MSGHNKFSKIKRLKAKTDAQKSSVFTKFAKMLQMEAKKVNGNISSPSLKAVIDRAKAADMPNDSIDRAIKKAMGANESDMETITYETYGPAGVAIIIEALTSNRNKAAAEIKHILSENGAKIANPGTVLWAFEKKDGEWKPKFPQQISDKNKKKLSDLIAALEEHDDVQNITANIG